ncbi:MAG: RagB/SusD family nutrient uptake outer membrane protein, partial [Flavobacteriales bacterium]
LGDKDNALSALNSLLIKRFKTNTFIPYVAATANDALQMVLQERRKELVYRGLRWTDVRRLNKLGANITMKREINGETYQLKPNELKFALAIPADIINMTGMVQNYR